MTIAEERGRYASSISAGIFAFGTEWFLSIKQRSRRCLFCRDIAISHFSFEIANLPVDIKCQSSRTFEFKNFLLDTKVILRTLCLWPNVRRIPVRIAVKLVIVNARNFVPYTVSPDSADEYAMYEEASEAPHCLALTTTEALLPRELWKTWVFSLLTLGLRSTPLAP